MAFKDDSFEERTARAKAAREAALAKLANRPAADPEVVAQRIAAQAAKEAALAEKSAAKKAAIAQAKADKIAAAEAAEAAKAASVRSVPTAAEMKQARDDRYAARKNRKK